MSTESPFLIDTQRIVRETFVRTVECHDELPSTNDQALGLGHVPGIELPRLIIAWRQTLGRGRGGNRWWSSAGALTFSLLLEPGADELPCSRWPEMSLTAGSSLCAALGRRLPGEDVRLKWPNDVYLRGKKVGGVLVEVSPQTSGRLVLGVGLNVNNPVRSAPVELRETAIAVCDVAGPQPVEEVLIDTLRSFDEQLQALSRDPESIRRQWRERDLLTGCTVTLDDGHYPLTGTCVGIDDDGALLLRTEAGTRRCYGGVVQTFR